MPRPTDPVAYDRREGDEPTLVFVPGWCCSRRDWAPIADALPGRASVAISLPGQGESPSDGRFHSLAELGRVVSDVVDHTVRSEVVLIGHSMGGAVAVEAARTLGGRAVRVICLDALHYDDWYRRRDDAFVRKTLDSYAADFPTRVRALVQHLFVDRTNSGLIDDIAATMSSVPVPDALAALRALLEWDRDRALRGTRVPVDVIASRAFLEPEIAAHLEQWTRITPVDFGGHFFLREDPARTAALIARII